MTHPFFGAGPMPRIFGHRGFVSAEHATAGILENTRTAISSALDAGANYVESDCQMTSDGQVVLFHDDTLKRTLRDSRRIATVSHAELASLMADRGGLLTLEEALREFPEARFNIDMKSAEVAEPAGTIVGSIAPERVLIGGFSDQLRLRSLAAAESEAGMRPATGAGQSTIVKVVTAIATRSTSRLDHALEGIDALQVPERHGPFHILNRGLLRAAHTRGIEVHVWTVNDQQRMRELVDLGVDGVITDRTDLAVEALRA